MTTDIPADIAGLRDALIEQRQYTLALYSELPPAWWNSRDFPYLATVNPPLWELAHIAWFQEFFALRWRSDDIAGKLTPSCLDVADQLFDSGRVPHQARWELAYPPMQICFDYMKRVLGNVVEALERSRDEDRYGFQLALAHEDMHAEALAMTLTTLGLALPDAAPKRVAVFTHGLEANEIGCVGGPVLIGASSRSFRFDNESPEHVEQLAPFGIDARVVTAAELSDFHASNAFRDQRFWSVEGNAWRERAIGRRQQSFGSHQTGDFAAMHVSYFEAEAYCRWKNRRLPTEAEWECAATTSVEFLASTGHVWEWTASPFAPYPGFRAARYRDYSEPWFHSIGILHRVLKGGSFATHPRLKYPQYRNFYIPDRNDMFCGVRTCAIA